ncbi:MAG TPA: type II secretion system protein GspL [Gallionellaceae bacterium]
MSVLRIYFSSQWRDSASACPWALCEDSGAVVQSGTGTLASMPRASECVAILAPDRTLLIEVKTPPGSRRQWKAALPFLAENLTLPDPEENHVVLAAAPADGQAVLAVADKAWLRRVADACRTAGLPLRRALPEVLMPERAKSGWTLVWDGATGFVRTGASSGMALDTGDAAHAPVALRLMLNQAATRRPEQIRVRMLPGAETALPHWEDFAVTLEAGEPWDWRRAPIAADVPNLLAGELAPPSRPEEWWPRLRPAAYILLALLLVEMLGSNLQWGLLAHEESLLKGAMERAFRKAFGNEAAMVNAPLQMRRSMADIRHGAGLEDDNDFFPLMDLSARALSRLPAGSVREVHYEGGQLEVEVNAASTAELDALQAGLRNSGFAVRADTHAAGNGYSARFILQLAASS